VSRRPRRDRPPRLDDLPDPAPDPAPGEPAVATDRRRLFAARITGVHPDLGRAAVRAATRALVAGDPRARLGCDGLDGCDPAEVRAALVASHGDAADAPRAVIDPDATLAGLHAAAERLRAAVADKARVAVATSRPASLLGLARWAADTVRAGDATLLGGTTATIEGGGRRELWWTGGVAVVTDGQALLAHDGVPGGDDWLFAVGRPDLVVADRGFAGAALRAGVETIAWADLDAPALALAAARGRPVVLVPLAERRPAAAYEAALGVLGAPPEPTSLG
jgi:hypothetical protein